MSNGPSLTDLLTSEALLSQKTLLKSGKSTTQDNNNNNNPSDSPSSTRAHRSISPLSDTSSSSTTSPPLNLDHSTPDVTQSPEPLNRGLENIKKQENKRYFKNRLSVALNELNSMSLEQMGARIQEMEDNDNEMTANASLSSHSSSSKHLSSSVSFDATANDDQTAGLTIKKSKSVDDSSDVQSSSLAGNKLRKSIIGVMARNQTKKRVMANVARALASYVPNLVITKYLKDSSLLQEPISAEFDGVILFADIAGFTPLTEKLAKLGDQGVEKLTLLLNDYFGRLIDIIKS